MKTQLSRPYPLGANLIENGCNFAIHAPHAENIRLALFSDQNDYIAVELPNRYAGIHHTFVPGVRAGQRYGYLVDTDNGPLLLSDPYARAIDRPLHYLTPYNSKKSFEIAKCVVTSDTFDWQDTQRPCIPREETVIFETHVKGISRQNPDVSSAQRGRYLGLISPAMLKFYKQQHITTLQLLPVAACMKEPHLIEMSMENYWGYNPFLFMAPDPRYAERDAVIELKTAIRELHRNGIEVILDVVYNHTAEGGENPRIFNLKALDSQYYIRHGCHFANFTGCGNTLDLRYQPSLNLVMDSLRYWVSEFQIDGFRFDLAATLGREGDNYNRESAFFKAVAQDPLLKEVKLIAEPWDIGPNGYQVGNFPFGWNECNDKLRDIARSFWRGDHGYLREFATRLMGSRDIYSAANWPYKLTVNYITYHDGFTLQDLVSYLHKHNEENGEHNRDGHGDNRSQNYGCEGPTDDRTIINIREKQKRNFMTSLLFAFGIPHILSADILSHSQKGNNNAYCQDNDISWLDWALNKDKKHFKQWLAEMVALRQTYMVPFINAFSGEKRNQHRVFWRREDGEQMEIEDWNTRNSLSLHMGLNTKGPEMLYLINQTQDRAQFTLPEENNQKWIIICNTNSNKTMQGKAQKKLTLAPSSMAILYYQPPKLKHDQSGQRPYRHP